MADHTVRRDLKAAAEKYVARLEAEIERLRAALTSISMHELRDHEDYTAIKDIAEAALRAHT